MAMSTRAHTVRRRKGMHMRMKVRAALISMGFQPFSRSEILRIVFT
jgi:hypothetical protein